MLHVHDVRELEAQLHQAGELAPGSTAHFLKEASTWFTSLTDRCVIENQSFAELCEQVRTSEVGSEGLRLACGALRMLRMHYLSRPELARFIVQFALDRISTIRKYSRRWQSVFISEREYRTAIDLFEVAQSDDRYSVQELKSRALQFIEKNTDSPGLFGRLAQDLQQLLAVLDKSHDAKHKEMARGALVYFVEKSDAIADDLGPIGLLDDAIVVARALGQIYPQRPALWAFLDAAVRRWPFLVDLALEAGGSTHQLSEYLLMNTAFALPDDLETAGGKAVAIVVAEAGPLPYVIGFLVALANVFSALQETVPVDFEVGDRLIDRRTHEEYVFEGYADAALKTCTKGEATYFKVRQPRRQGKRRAKLGKANQKAGDVTVLKSIEELPALQHSRRETLTLQTGRTQIDLATTPLGVLERLFRKVIPVTVPDNVGQVIVVSPLGEAQEIGRAISIFGTPILDVLPTGAMSCEDVLTQKNWSTHPPGDRQIVSVVRTTAEALEIAEQPDQQVCAVITSIGHNSTDAANAKQLAKLGIRILALVEELDEESQTVFEQGDFRFWVWDEDWLSHLHWPASKGNTVHAIARHEAIVKSAATSILNIIEVSDPNIDSAYDFIRTFEESAAHRDDETLVAAVGTAYQIFVRLLRKIGPLVENDESLLGRLQQQIRSGELYWPRESANAGREAFASLVTAASELRLRNRKREALEQWVSQHQSGTVIAPASERPSHRPQVGWVSSVKRGTRLENALVMCWFSRAAMERLVFPPVADELTLVLYKPEQTWFQSAQARRSRLRDKVSRLSRARSAVPRAVAGDGRVADKPSAVSPLPAPPPIDEVLLLDRRRRALSSTAAESAEMVDATLVFFAGGNWAAFLPDAKIYTFTHLLSRGSEAELPQKPVAHLQPGDRVMMVRGSDRDVVAITADRKLQRGIRETAALWQTALRRFIERGHSISMAHSRLRNAGCMRSMQTVRGWLLDNRRIGPQEPLEDALRAIQIATEDPGLGKRLKDCANAIRLVRSAHVTAGHELQQQVLARVREWLDSDALPEEVVQVEEQVLLLTVESVDNETAKVPRHHVNRLREDS